MIKLFRKTHKKLVSDKTSISRTANYLKYAIGEIVLVVIGILIALSINIWNQNRKNRTLITQIAMIKNNLIITKKISANLLNQCHQRSIKLNHD